LSPKNWSRGTRTARHGDACALYFPIASRVRTATRFFFYFGPDGLLPRHDYHMDLMAGDATADYTDDHQVFGGISFPTLRRTVGRLLDGITEPEPAYFAIDIDRVTVASR
jgi:hypothetical protein